MFDALNPLRLRDKLGRIVHYLSQIEDLRDLTLSEQTRQLQLSHPNPLCRLGKKCFSQADEDGITLEILRRLDLLDGGVYAEFGVGDGTENNTLILAALGWKGFWVGGETLKPDLSKANPKAFAYLKKWITRENVFALARQGLARIEAEHPDLISLDLDGNDIYLVDELLTQGLRPRLFIVEYNGKFPPPVEFQITYDAAHTWQGTDYFGASLASYTKLFGKHRYRLVCCNAMSGANAFFIDEKFSDRFTDIPTDLETLFVPPRYFRPKKHGHPASLRTIEKILNDL
jgi:hypothetical protein